MQLNGTTKKRLAAHRYYLRNSVKMKARARAFNVARNAALRVFVRKVKEISPCVDCGRTYPWPVMEFHHREGEEKRGNVSSMMSQSLALKTIQDEINKCDVLCANCHRLRTFGTTMRED